MDDETKRAIIMEHYAHPYHREDVNNPSYIKVNTNNESCIDNLNIYLLIEEQKIKDIKFTGEACAISTSSASIMINELINKSLDEAKQMINNFEKMLHEEEYNPNIIGEAIVYDNLAKQKNRLNCAILPYKGILKAIEEYEETTKK